VHYAKGKLLPMLYQLSYTPIERTVLKMKVFVFKELFMLDNYDYTTFLFVVKSTYL
jgi:hypothetical protein